MVRWYAHPRPRSSEDLFGVMLVEMGDESGGERGGGDGEDAGETERRREESDGETAERALNI